jgi:MFS family permease
LVITTASLGSLLAFNVFLKFLLDDFKWDRGPTAAALSLSLVTMGLLSPLAGSLADRYGARHLVSLGGVLLGVSYLLLSRIEEMWQLYALYMALGVSLSGILMPVVGAVSRRFQRGRGLALGVGVSGFTLGTAVVPLSAAGIISAVGWRDTYVLLGLSVGVVVLALGQLMGGQPVAGRHNLGHGLSLPQAAGTGTFWKVLLAIGLSLAGVHIVLTHLVTYATDLGLTATRGTLLVSLTGLAGFIGMLVMGGLSDRTGSRLPWVLSAAISVLALALLMSLKVQAIVYPFVILYGFAWGGYAVLMRAMVAEFFGLRSVAAVAGGLQLGANVLAATGPATSGFVFDRTGSYDLAFLLAAALFIMGAALMLWARAKPEQHQ